VVAKCNPDAAGWGLFDESGDEGEDLVVGRAAVDEVAVEHEDVVLVGPVEPPILVSDDNWLGLWVICECQQRTTSGIEIAVDITDGDDCRRCFVGWQSVDLVSERRVQFGIWNVEWHVTTTEAHNT
jgi:hypothetical protein